MPPSLIGKKVATAVKKAMKRGPAEPVQPLTYMQRYARSSLVKKLGFKPGMKVAVLAAPDDFEEKLGELPEGVELQSKVTRETALAIWFCPFARGTRRGAGISNCAAARPQRGLGSFIRNKRADTGWTSIKRDVVATGFCGGPRYLQGVRRGCRLVGVDVPAEEICRVIDSAACRFDV